MPRAPQRPCRQPGCAALVAAPATRCPAHSTPLTAHHTERRARDRFRGSAAARGYDSRWQAARLGFLARYPLCPGVLIPTADWTPALAETFHIIRELERESGRLLTFSASAPSPQPSALSSQRSALDQWLAENPIYHVEPWDIGRAATEVDHIVPHRGDPALLWAEWNWQALTKRAHSRKTATEDRGSHEAEVLSRQNKNDDQRAAARE